MTLSQPTGMRLLPRSLGRLRRRRREQAGGCQLLLFAAFLRGQTAPRLAFLGVRALSKPRIPRVLPELAIAPEGEIVYSSPSGRGQSVGAGRVPSVRSTV